MENIIMLLFWAFIGTCGRSRCSRRKRCTARYRSRRSSCKSNKKMTGLIKNLSINACPSGCLYKDETTGLTLYNNEYCIGCHSCAMACPFGAPTFDDDDKMNKCDGCIDRQKGRLTTCLKTRECAGNFFNALKMVDVDDNPTEPNNSLIHICEEIVRNQK